MAEGEPKPQTQNSLAEAAKEKPIDATRLSDTSKSFREAKEPQDKEKKTKELLALVDNASSREYVATTCGADIKKAHEAIIKKQAAGTALEGWESSLLDLHNILFGAETIANKLKKGTDADKKKIEDFKSTKKEQIRTVLQDIKNNPNSANENVKKLEGLMNLELNKAEFKSIMKELMNDPEHKDNIVLKTFVTSSIEAATKKGFSIESSDDLKLLEASPKWKDIINKANPKIEPKENTKFIAIGDKIMPILSPSEKGVAGALMFAETDFDHFNLKDGVTPTANTLKRKIEGGKIDLSQLQSGIDQLINSNNPIMKGLGEFFKFFGKLLGFYKEGEKMAPNLKKMPDGLRIEMLGKIIARNAEKEVGYDINKIEFSNGDLKNPKEEKNQKYIADLQKMLEIDEKTKDENGKEILVYGTKTKEKVLAKQKELFPEAKDNDKHTGQFDKVTAEEWLNKLKPQAPKVETPATPKEEPKSIDVNGVRLTDGQSIRLSSSIKTAVNLRDLGGKKIGTVKTDETASIDLSEGKGVQFIKINGKGHNCVPIKIGDRIGYLSTQILDLGKQPESTVKAPKGGNKPTAKK